MNENRVKGGKLVLRLVAGLVGLAIFVYYAVMPIGYCVVTWLSPTKYITIRAKNATITDIVVTRSTLRTCRVEHLSIGTSARAYVIGYKRQKPGIAVRLETENPGSWYAVGCNYGEPRDDEAPATLMIGHIRRTNSDGNAWFWMFPDNGDKPSSREGKTIERFIQKESQKKNLPAEQNSIERATNTSSGPWSGALS